MSFDARCSTACLLVDKRRVLHERFLPVVAASECRQTIDRDTEREALPLLVVILISAQCVPNVNLNPREPEMEARDDELHVADDFLNQSRCERVVFVRRHCTRTAIRKCARSCKPASLNSSRACSRAFLCSIAACLKACGQLSALRDRETHRSFCLSTANDVRGPATTTTLFSSMRTGSLAMRAQFAVT